MLALLEFESKRREKKVEELRERKMKGKAYDCY
jgi:hypothetical protein